MDVLNFQSFNSYNAEGLGCTTYSFAVNLGCYLLYVPETSPGRIKRSENLFLPQEYECFLRGHLTRSFEQPELDRRDIWYIDPAGRYLGRAIHDVRMAFLRDGQPWFERFANRSALLKLLLEEEESMLELWGFGRLGSPMRLYLTGYVAKASGEMKIAREALIGAARTESFAHASERLLRDAEGAA